MRAFEIYNPTKIIKPHIEAIHGHTRIDLRDVHTGKRERIESDNTVTDGIENFMRSLGAFDNSPFANSTFYGSPLWQNLIGGIFLFDTAIGTTNTYMPAGTKMIANGSCGVSNSSTTTEFGSYNASESSASSSTIVQVYDWATNQGNGSIASVCLTSATGGYIGYGNSTSNTAMSTTKSFINNQTSTSYTHPVSQAPYIIYNNTIYWPSASTVASGATSMTINSAPFAMDSVGLMESYPPEAKSTRTVSFTAIGALSRITTYGNNFVLVPQAAVASGSTFSLYIISAVTGTATEYTVTNNTGYSILAQNASSSYRGAKASIILLDDTYLFARCSDGNIYKINYTTSAVSSVTITDGSTSGVGRSFGKLPNGLISNTPYIIDTTNNTAYITNETGGGTSWGGLNQYDYNSTYDCMLQESAGSSNATITAYKNPLYLATINNLDSAVTKTSSLTMKVTYTITMS